MSAGQKTQQGADSQTARRDPMSDESVEKALLFMVNSAPEAGAAKAQAIYMEHYRKVVLARLKREAPATEKSDAARDSWARAHAEYAEVLAAQYQAVARDTELYWKRVAAEAAIEAWRTKNANVRGAHRMT